MGVARLVAGQSKTSYERASHTLQRRLRRNAAGGTENLVGYRVGIKNARVFLDVIKLTLVASADEV